MLGVPRLREHDVFKELKELVQLDQRRAKGKKKIKTQLKAEEDKYQNMKDLVCNVKELGLYYAIIQTRGMGFVSICWSKMVRPVFQSLLAEEWKNQLQWITIEAGRMSWAKLVPQERGGGVWRTRQV